MISKQDKSSIKQMFDSISKNYDLMNDIMSFGMNPIVKKLAVSRIKANNPSKILDLCTGTGDIAINLAKKFPDAEIIAVDFSEKMLEIARKRASKFKNIKFINHDVTDLPFEDNYFDVCTISFGLRNLPDVKQALIGIKRVLKKGGCFSTLDLGKPNKFFDFIFKPYFFYIVPILGKIIKEGAEKFNFQGKLGFFKPDLRKVQHMHSREERVGLCETRHQLNDNPYEYLPQSNIDFPSQAEMLKILDELGFKEAKNYDYAFGTMAQQIAKG